MFPVWETGKHWGSMRAPCVFLENFILILLTFIETDRPEFSLGWQFNLDFLKALSNNSSLACWFRRWKDLSRLTSLALDLATSSLEITFSLRLRVINKSRIKKRSTCGKSKFNPTCNIPLEKAGYLKPS